MTQDPKNMHPNSLANLRPNWDKESAAAAREKGHETRRQNKIAREKLKVSMSEWKKYRTEVLDQIDLSPVDMLKIQAAKFYEEGDIDSAVDIWKSIAEFEVPKLQKVDQTNREGSIEDLSEEELNAKLKDLLKEEDNEL